jgi:hypothetical protein
MSRRPPKPPSPRAQRRADERVLAKIADDRVRLAQLSEGGSPDRPIPVETSALVEPRAASMPCPRCGGEARVEDHIARAVDGDLLRAAHTRCRQCGFLRTVWFRVAPRLVN